MEQFWEGFCKRAEMPAIYKGVSKSVGLGARGGHIPIPGMRTHPANPTTIPGHGAVSVSKKMSIKPISQQSRGMPGSNL